MMKMMMMKKITCPDCTKQLDLVTGCDHDYIIVNEGIYRRIKHEGRGWCPTCLACLDHTHHFGCETEVCPRCTQLVMDCACEVRGIIKAGNIQEAEDAFINQAAAVTKTL